MTIKFELTQDDYMVFFRRSYKKQSIIFKKSVFLIALALAFIIRLYHGPEKLENIIDGKICIQNSNFWIDSLFYFIMLILFILILRLVIIQRTKKLIRNNPHLIGDREIEFLPNSIQVRTKIYNTEYYFEAFIRAEEIKDYYFLYISNDSALIFPKRAFSDQEIPIFIKEKFNVYNGSL
jgi:succinate dehydrogenase hydrophobic anchor subunit